jgi:hypothetical protein
VEVPIGNMPSVEQVRLFSRNHIPRWPILKPTCPVVTHLLARNQRAFVRDFNEPSRVVGLLPDNGVRARELPSWTLSTVYNECNRIVEDAIGHNRQKLLCKLLIEWRWLQAQEAE